MCILAFLGIDVIIYHCSCTMYFNAGEEYLKFLSIAPTILWYIDQ